MLEPLEKLQLPEGKEVTLTIQEFPHEPDLEAFRKVAGRWRGT